MHKLETLARMTYDETESYDNARKIVNAWNRSGWPDGVLVSDDLVMRAVALALLNSSRPRVKSLPIFIWANEGIRLQYGLSVARYEISRPIADGG